MKICEDCNITKPLCDFSIRGKSKVSGKVWYRKRCKKCCNLKFRPPTGEISSTRFKKGHVSWNFGLLQDCKSRSAKKAIKWRDDIFKRDGSICKKCNSKNRIHAHHIKSWKDFPELRFILDNGITLCNSCHANLHCNIDGYNKQKVPPWNKGLKGVQVAWNKGVPCSPEIKKRLSDINKGKTLSLETKIKISEALKGRETSKEHRRKLSEASKRFHALKRQKKIEEQLVIEGLI